MYVNDTYIHTYMIRGYYYYYYYYCAHKKEKKLILLCVGLVSVIMVYYYVGLSSLGRSDNVDWSKIDAGDCVDSYCVPSAVMIGCQKCGSTALANLLLMHPQVRGRTGGNAFSVSRFKHDFWSRTFRRERVSFQSYVQQNAFLLRAEDRHRGTITFEKSPDYIASEKAAEEMKDSMPSVKLLAILRNPVRRAYSAFMWQCNKGRVVQRDNRVMTQKSIWTDISPYINPFSDSYSSSSNQMCTPELFDKYLETAELKRYKLMDSVIGKGMYAIQLRQWMSHFDKSQFHIVLLEQFSSDPRQVMNELLNFLNLESWNESDLELSNEQLNRGKYRKPMSESAQTILRSVYKDSISELSEMFPEIDFQKWWSYY